jgi:hypothetical protein
MQIGLKVLTIVYDNCKEMTLSFVLDNCFAFASDFAKQNRLTHYAISDFI